MAPEEGEETRLADQRQQLQRGEKRAEAVRAALEELVPRDRRSHAPASALRAAARVLQRLVSPSDATPDPASEALAALESAPRSRWPKPNTR